VLWFTHAVRILFTLTLFLSSGLLFLVQPMVARIILPAFGGSSGVWTASMLFFQALLLLGYAYAHFASRALGARRHALIHVPLMGLALLLLPIPSQPRSGAEGQTMPTLALLGELLRMVGLVFFVVSAGAPLLQRWFATTRDPQAKDPYFLYSASNVGSMAALLAYPLLVEPRLRLSEQTRLWSWAYGALVVAVALCALATRSGRDEAAAETTEEAQAAPRPAMRERLYWLALAAVPSSLLLGVTNYLSINIAPVPLLWVVPLALYLITFILAFASRPLLSYGVLSRVAPLAITPLAVAIILESSEPLIPLAAVHLTAFFVTAWMCHARLSERRPAAAHLTEFYLWISLGGVIGGFVNAVIAPSVFNTLFEYPLALALAGMLRPRWKEDAPKWNQLDGLFPVGVLAVTAVVAFTVRRIGMPAGTARTLLTIGLPALLCFIAVDRPYRYGLSLLALFVGASVLQVSSDGNVVLRDRSFYGVNRVVFSGPSGRFHRLTHGNTLHGIQDMQNPDRPLTYYHRTGPIGQVFQEFSGAKRKERVALVGLGVGSLAAYGEPGQEYTFFEIDPVVSRIAQDPKYFSYLSRSKAKMDVVLGDARLTLQRQPDGRFGLIVLDAFSSDAIPVHLLTREAVQMYLRKLSPDGVLAFHVSNRYLELAPVLAAIGKDLGLVTMEQTDGPSPDEEAEGKTQSMWVIVARRKADLGGLGKRYWSEAEPLPGVAAWTDDYSNLLSVLRKAE